MSAEDAHDFDLPFDLRMGDSTPSFAPSWTDDFLL